LTKASTSSLVLLQFTRRRAAHSPCLEAPQGGFNPRGARDAAALEARAVTLARELGVTKPPHLALFTARRAASRPSPRPRCDVLVFGLHDVIGQSDGHAGPRGRRLRRATDALAEWRSHHTGRLGGLDATQLVREDRNRR